MSSLIIKGIPLRQTLRIGFLRKIQAQKSYTLIRNYGIPTNSSLILGGLSCAGLSLLMNPDDCQCYKSTDNQETSKNTPTSPKSNDDDFNRQLSSIYGSNLGKLSFAGILGYCCGTAVKEIGKTAVVTVGTVFLLLQIAATRGYLVIHWKKIQKDAISVVDPSGKGKITPKDLALQFQKLQKYLQYNLPSTAGFSGGFLFGLSKLS